MMVNQLRAALRAEHERGVPVTEIARQLGISQPGLRKFLIGESDGNGRLLDSLARRYKMRLVRRGK